MQYAFVTSAVLALTASAAALVSSERDVEAVLADLDAAEAAAVDWQSKGPQVDRARSNDPEYRAAFMAERERHEEKMLALVGTLSDHVGELFALQPTHERLTQMLPFHWEFESGRRGRYLAVVDETTRALELELAEGTLVEAGYWRVFAMGRALLTGEKVPFTRADVVAGAREFWTNQPNDPRSPGLMYDVAENAEMASAEQRELLQELVRRFPGKRETRAAQSLLAILDRVGQPVELAFEEAITGESISIEGLAGKVVVLDFWATWCGPCVAEMPHMKELYAKYRPQGVEFIGVSLDAPVAKGGLAKLQKFVADNEIPWPQYYQGNGWESQFSGSWGISSIPALFVIDQEGNLHHPKARGKLDQILPKLLDGSM